MSEVQQYSFDAPTANRSVKAVDMDRPPVLADAVDRAVTSYMDALDGEPMTDLYKEVLAQVEVPLIQAVLKKTRNNQSKTAKILGLNRGTLRKKLKLYGLH